MASLPLVPLDDAVVFPGMPVTIPAISGNDRRVLLIPRRGVGYARVGVVAEVTKRHTIRGTDVIRSTRCTAASPASPTATRTACCGSRWTNIPTSRRRRS